MRKRLQLGTLFIAVSLLFGASATAAEQERNLRHTHNADQHKAAASAAERERNLRDNHNTDQHKAAGPSEERQRKLRDKHNPDQHKNVSDDNWYTMYFDPGITNIYITCDGEPPKNSNELQIECQTPAVWASCSPNGPGGAAAQNICECASHASEQHSGQYKMYKCPSGK